MKYLILILFLAGCASEEHKTISEITFQWPEEEIKDTHALYEMVKKQPEQDADDMEWPVDVVENVAHEDTSNKLQEVVEYVESSIIDKFDRENEEELSIEVDVPQISVIKKDTLALGRSSVITESIK